MDVPRATERLARQRCKKFTEALKANHPPGSPVFQLFQAFVTCAGADEAARRARVVELCDLLRPDRKLLHQFYGLLPAWAFKR